MECINPCLLLNVVEQVFKYIPARELEINRLVCKIWDEEASRALRKRRLISFRCMEEVKTYLCSMWKTKQFPHARFQFLFDDVTGLVDETMQEFWVAFGSKIEHLDLQQSHTFWRDLAVVVGGTALPQLSSLFLKHLPMHIWDKKSLSPSVHKVKSVKLLKLGSIPFIDGGVNGATERLLDLMKLLPNLEEIQFSPYQCTASARWERVSIILSNALANADVNLPKLKRIGIKLILDDETTLGFASKTFSFEVLEVSFLDDLRTESLTPFFSSLQSTLTSLKVNFPGHIQFNRCDDFNKCLQKLKNLEELEIQDLERQPSFIAGMPALRKLKFGTTELCSVLMPAGDPNVKLLISDLEIYNNSSTQSVTEIERILLCFPMINTLSLNGIDDDELSVILRSLPLLSSLELLDSQITDQGISGVPMSACIDYNKSTFPKIAIRGMAKRLRTGLHIGSLHYLCELKICAPQMTDAGIVFGINEMTHLRKLKLASNEITDDGILLLTDEMRNRLSYLDISQCPKITILGVVYAESKIHGDLLVAKTVDVTRIGHNRRSLHNSEIGYVELRENDIARTRHRFAVSRNYNFFIDVNIPIHWIPRTRVIGYSNLRLRKALKRHYEFMMLLKGLGYDRFMKSFRQGIINEMQLHELGNREIPFTETEKYEFGTELIPDYFVVKIYRAGVTLRDLEHWLKAGGNEVQ